MARIPLAPGTGECRGNLSVVQHDAVEAETRVGLYPNGSISLSLQKSRRPSAYLCPVMNPDR